jgi:hypothetical protein
VSSSLQRGKVLRIVLDLLSHCPEPGIFGQDVWNWWNMVRQMPLRISSALHQSRPGTREILKADVQYSQVQFFQIIPQKENEEAEARDPRPASSAGP